MPGTPNTFSPPTPAPAAPTRPAPTGRRKSAAQRHAELLDAAVAIGATDGLGAVTLARVADAVGVSQGLVHHYFTSAEEMVNATFRHAADADLAAARDTVASAATAREQIGALFDYVFDDASAEAAVLWIDAASMSRRSPTLAKQAHDVNTGWLAFLADIVTHGTRTGEFHVTQPHTTARRLLTIIDGLGNQTGTLSADELRGIAADFARHELGLT